MASALIALLVVSGGLYGLHFDGRPSLQSEMVRMTSIVDDTVGALGSSGEATLLADAKPGAPFDWPDDRFTYDKCDSLWNLVFPGWQAGFGYQIATDGAEERSEVLGAVQKYWLTIGDQVTLTSNPVGIELELEDSTYRLYTNSFTGQLDLLGSTTCLPTDS